MPSYLGFPVAHTRCGCGSWAWASFQGKCLCWVWLVHLWYGAYPGLHCCSVGMCRPRHRITSLSILPLFLCFQTCSVSFNGAMIILFVSIDLNIINTLLIRLWLWVRKCPRVSVMKIWGVYSVWVHTEASFIPYHRFPPNPFFDCLCISSSLSFFPSGKPLNKTFPRLSFASRVCCWRPTAIFFKQQQGHPIPFIITLGLSLLILVHGERKQTKKKASPGSLTWDS